MGKEIDWASLFDKFVSELNAIYINSKSYKIEHDFNKVKLNPDLFLEQIKTNFLQNIDSNIYRAFCILQKQLPLLAEHLILYSYNNKLLKKNVFSKTFVRIYAYAKKDFTLFSNEINSDKLLEIFKYCDKSSMINDEDEQLFNSLDNVIKIYRGTAGKTEEVAKKGISWTLNYEKAKEFAEYNHKHYNADFKHITEGTIQKENIIVYIHNSERFEHEVIVDPSKIYNHKFNILT